MTVPTAWTTTAWITTACNNQPLSKVKDSRWQSNSLNYLITQPVWTAHHVEHVPSQTLNLWAVTLPSKSPFFFRFIFFALREEFEVVSLCVWSRAWILGGCLVGGGWIGLIPLCVNASKDVSHRCSNCYQLIARWHRSDRVDVNPPSKAKEIARRDREAQKKFTGVQNSSPAGRDGCVSSSALESTLQKLPRKT